MNDSEKIKMQLHIGDQRITLTVPFNRQDFVRATEADVDSLYNKWRKAFPAKTDREILTMVAYQYASFYGELKERYDNAATMVDELLEEFSPRHEQPEDQD